MAMNKNQLQMVSTNNRISSLDIMRGFSMFWLVGGAAIVGELAHLDFIEGTSWLADQMHHRSWEGLKFFDLIFPFFIFASGATLPYSIARMKSKGMSNNKVILSSFRRALVLAMIGVAYNEWTAHSFANPRLCSVLAQIGVSYFISTSIFIFNRSRRRLLVAVIIILLLITALQTMIPGSSLNWDINPENSINSYIDSLMPGRLYRSNYDPEGPLNWISASSVSLLGAWTSSQIIFGEKSGYRFGRTFAILLVVGICLIAVGLIADTHYPIIKQVWTGSFCALSGGISIIFYLLIYSLVEIKNIKKPFYILKIIGANSLLAYVASRVFGYSQFTEAFGKYLSEAFFIESTFLGILLTMIATLLILNFFYKKKIFLRV